MVVRPSNVSHTSYIQFRMRRYIGFAEMAAILHLCDCFRSVPSNAMRFYSSFPRSKSVRSAEAIASFMPQRTSHCRKRSRTHLLSSLCHSQESLFAETSTETSKDNSFVASSTSTSTTRKRYESSKSSFTIYYNDVYEGQCPDYVHDKK